MTTTAWAIKAPDGTIDVSTIRDSESHVEASYKQMYGHKNWNWLVANSYRCVKVHITEAQE